MREASIYGELPLRGADMPERSMREASISGELLVAAVALLLVAAAKLK